MPEVRLLRRLLSRLGAHIDRPNAVWPLQLRQMPAKPCVGHCENFSPKNEIEKKEESIHLI